MQSLLQFFKIEIETASGFAHMNQKVITLGFCWL